jgi:hypothetical protein
MIKRVLSVTAFVTLVFGASPASAASFTVNFCPGDATCPTGVTEASLTFDEILGGDPNDYLLTLRLAGGPTAPAFIDEVQFTIEGAQTPPGTNDYEFKPTLSSAPLGVGNWSVYYDAVDGSAGACTADTGSANAICAQPASWPSANGINDWVFLVDLVDGFGPLGVGSGVNLRAQFLKADGKNAGILSPGGGTLVTTTGTVTTTGGVTTGSVPEPTAFALVGLGLILGAHRLRSRS